VEPQRTAVWTAYFANELVMNTDWLIDLFIYIIKKTRVDSAAAQQQPW